MQGSDLLDVDRLISDAGRGDRAAMERLLPVIYRELQGIARHRLAGERDGHTLQVTDLVHEAYLRLAAGNHELPARWTDRPHFFAIAARVMRHVLIDHARARASDKRGGGAERVTLSALDELADERGPEVQLDALHRALDELAHHDPRAASVVELRCFAGLSIAEVSEALGVAVVTVKRDWTYASAWLRRALSA
jgi:RNA polymerase sigma factor (TIGR02999 family)